MNVTYTLLPSNGTSHGNNVPSNVAGGEDLNLKYEEFYHTAQFITGLVCYPIIVLVGLTGNLLTLIVLNHKKMNTSTNVLLRALAVADTMKLLNDGLYFLVLVLLRTTPKAGNNMLGYMYPVSHYIFNEAVCVTAWLTVFVAVERYISVCHPTRAKELCTLEKARVVSVVVFICMSLLAVPSALRYTKITLYDNATNDSYFEIVPSEIGRNEEFMTVYTWIQNLLRSVIPLFVLIILNACIIHALRRQRVKGKKMTARNRITFMLLSVVLVFLICITPDAIMSTFFGYGYVDENNLVKGIREFTDLLLAVNSAVNFVIYCAFSKVFREAFIEIFCKNVHIRRIRLQDGREDNQQRLLGPPGGNKRPTPSVTPDMSKKLIANGDKITVVDGAQTFV